MNIISYLNYLQTLEGRAQLNSAQRKDLMSYQSGLEGESIFRSILNTIDGLNYLYNFEFNHLQIDFLVELDNTLIIFEVKHYSGEWKIEGDYIKNNFNTQIQSPIIQLKKIVYSLYTSLHHLDIDVKIKSYIIFTNPHFLLLNKHSSFSQIILPHQLYKIFQIIDVYPKQSKYLSQIKQLQSNHSSYYQKEVITDFSSIHSGLRCPYCKKLYTIKIESIKKFNICQYCMKKISNQHLVSFNLKELYTLKMKPFDLNEAINWCKPMQPHIIRRVCNQYFLSNKKRNKQFYIE